jgi:hypothetical protein
MPSSLENELQNVLLRVRSKLRDTDRAVVIGSALSWIPIFPACTIGLLISLANLYLIKAKKLDHENYRTVLVSVFIALLFSLIWVISFYFVNPFGLINDIIDQIYLHIQHLVSLILDSVGLGGSDINKFSVKV